MKIENKEGIEDFRIPLPTIIVLKKRMKIILLEEEFKSILDINQIMHFQTIGERKPMKRMKGMKNSLKMRIRKPMKPKRRNNPKKIKLIGSDQNIIDIISSRQHYQ